MEANRRALVELSLDGGSGGSELLRDAARALLTRLSAEAEAAEMRRRLAAGLPSIPHSPSVDTSRVSAGDAASDVQGAAIMRSLLSGDAFGMQRRNYIRRAHIEAAFRAGACPGVITYYLCCDEAGVRALDQSIVGWHRNVKELGMPPVVAVGQQMLQLIWQALGDLGLLRKYVERRGADGLAGAELQRVLVRILELEGYSSLWALDRESDPDDAPFIHADRPGLDLRGVVLVSFGGDAASARVHEVFNAWRDIAGRGRFSGHLYAHPHPLGGTLGLRVSVRPSPLEPSLCRDPDSGRRAGGAEALIRGGQAQSRADMLALGWARHQQGMGGLMDNLVLPSLGYSATARCPQLLDSASPAVACWPDITDVSTAA